AYIAARSNFIAIDHHGVETVGYFLPHGIGRIERIAALIHVSELHGFAERDAAAVWLFLTNEHAQERGLTSAVTTDDAHDAAARHIEGQVIDEHAITEAFGDVIHFDDLLTETRSRRNVEFERFVTSLEFFRLQFFEASQAGLALGLTAFRIL